MRIDLGREPRRLEVQDTPKGAGKVAVPRRLHPPAVEVRPLAAERIRDRHDDTAAQELAPLGRDDAEADELLADLAALRDHLQKDPSA